MNERKCVQKKKYFLAYSTYHKTPIHVDFFTKRKRSQYEITEPSSYKLYKNVTKDTTLSQNEYVTLSVRAGEDVWLRNQA